MPALVQIAAADRGWPEAVSIVHKHGQCLANNNEYDIYIVENFRIDSSKITRDTVYWDISPIIKALRNT